LNLSVADVLAYAELKRQGSDLNFYSLLADTCKAIDHGQNFRLIEDLPALVPGLKKCTQFLQQYQSFLIAIATKKDISPQDTTISFLKSIGLPLLHTSQNLPTLESAAFYPLGDYDANGKFISFHGFSKVRLLNSLLSTYPLSLTNKPEDWFPQLMGSMRFIVRIDYYLLSTFKEFRELDQNGFEVPPSSTEERRSELNAVYNFINHKAADLSNPSEPKFTLFEYYYFLLFVIHALYQADQLELFSLRHPLVNFILGDDNFHKELKILNEFFSNPSMLQLTQEAHDYSSFSALFKRALNNGDFVHPTAYNNKPQAYLLLATNNDIIFQFKWHPVIAKILSKELNL
jgi:hypothetical protein